MSDLNAEITAYIESIEKAWQREILRKVRTLIHKIDPKIDEKLKWGSPAFDHSGPVIWMFCASRWVHISFPHGAILDHSHKLFEQTDNRGQRTIKIKEKSDFPHKELSNLIAEAVDNNVKGKKVSFNIPKPGSKKFDLPKIHADLLKKEGLYDIFLKRPFYQQSGWIRWIDSAKQEVTKQKRANQMLDELRTGNTYMKMPW
jgi:hypothetical protein